jgi:hypothetical protein
MTTLIRRTLLISSTAIIALAVLPAIGALAPVSLSGWVEQQAQARGGSDDGDNDSSDDSGSDDGGSRDSGSGGGSSHGGNDDGPDHDSGDDHGGDRDDDDSDDDNSADDSADDSGKNRGRGRGGDRDEIRLIVNDGQLQGLLSGSMIAVDQNGKRLRFEVEQEHGNTEIKLRAPKGTLTGVTVIPTP